jgi:hypothetical protein
MYLDSQRETYRKVSARFPATFGLRGFPGEVFRLSESASYFRGKLDSSDESDLVLYTERRNENGEWSDWVKGSEAELRRELVTAPA